MLDTVTWEWNKPIPVGTPPTKRSGHSAAFNRQGHVYFFGGWDGIRMRSDLAILSVSGAKGQEALDAAQRGPALTGVRVLQVMSTSTGNGRNLSCREQTSLDGFRLQWPWWGICCGYLVAGAKVW